jgi:hypothetical protein
MEDELQQAGADLEANPASAAALAAEERLASAVERSRQQGPGAFLELCRHVVGDRAYADSTRAVFAELLEQARAALGRG